MNREYDTYGPNELLAHSKMPLKIVKDDKELYSGLAREMADEIIAHNKKGEKTVMICPVGPVGQYPYFVDIVNKELISLKNAWFLNMDEYITDDGKWIDINDPLSFRGFMRDTVYTRIDPDLLMPEEQRVFPDPENPAAVDALINELGGVDLCVGGIGINGHVAFNEADGSLTPENFLNQGTRVRTVSDMTKVTAAVGDFHGALEEVPNYCITIGMKQIAASRKIRLGCFRDWHKGVVKRAACGEKTSAFPVTLLRDHKDISLTITEFVAGWD